MRCLSSLPLKALKNKICLLRLDLNTKDNWRIEASRPTMRFLSKYCRATVILSHKGRPKGFNKSLSLRSAARALSKAFKKKVVFTPHFRFAEIKKQIRSAPRKSIFLLENLRFLEGETINSGALAKNLALLGDFYVNDAFAVSHRANASVAAITDYLPSCAGFELEAEIKNLSRVMKNPKKPLVVILGGGKIKNKLSVYKYLRNKASVFLIGGALNENILKLKSKKLLMPADFKKENGDIKDIGPKTVKLFEKEIRRGRTILWNGPVGDIGKKRFQNGTKELARAVAANRRAFKTVGGGETVMFLKKMKLDKKIDFISTGGGAMLEFLAGKKLPGIEVLKR